MGDSLALCYKNGVLEAGCDEAGRGSLAGPVFAAAVILSTDYNIPGLNDSKKIPLKQRKQLRNIIEEKALSYGVAYLNNEVIDTLNIFKATMMAMHQAISKLTPLPAHILIDGHLFYPYKNVPHTCIVKGDAKYQSIAAASILAKTYRDDYMEKLHGEISCYEWNQNKGYGTLKHRQAIQEHGISRYHRKSFKLTEKQLKINF